MKCRWLKGHGRPPLDSKASGLGVRLLLLLLILRHRLRPSVKAEGLAFLRFADFLPTIWLMTSRRSLDDRLGTYLVSTYKPRRCCFLEARTGRCRTTRWIRARGMPVIYTALDAAKPGTGSRLGWRNLDKGMIAMATKAKPRYTNGLVDLRVGQISREIFVDEEIYHEEQEQIFARVWLFVGHESQVQKPGDYFISCMGEESVILCRDREDQIHVFLNSCRHRGMKVCRYDEGNTPIFTCPYHGWSYATDGKLVGVPFSRMPIRGNWTSPSGAWRKWPKCLTTRAVSGQPGILRPRPSWNTSAT